MTLLGHRETETWGHPTRPGRRFPVETSWYGQPRLQTGERPRLPRHRVRRWFGPVGALL